MTSPDSPPGRRVAYWRTRRHMSQQVFADRLGKSKSWVDKIERGVRRLDKVSVLRAIADVLHIDVAQLTGSVAVDDEPTDVTVRAEITELEAALARYDTVITSSDRLPDLSPDQLAKNIRHAWLTLEYGRYEQLLAALPRLIAEGERRRRDHSDGQISGLLGQTYQITAALLRKIGEAQLAWVAADRAMTLSEAAGDPLLATRAVVPLAAVVRDLGQRRRAVELCLVVAHQAPDRSFSCAEQLSVYGALLIEAALAAAQIGDEATAAELVDEAAEAAKHVDGNHLWTQFGPAAVATARVATAVELGEAAAAVAAHVDATARPGYQRMPPACRAHHLVTAARGYAHAGDVTAAGHWLLEAASIAPAEVRMRPVAREALRTVIRRSQRPDPLLVQLAESIGVDVAGDRESRRTG